MIPLAILWASLAVGVAWTVNRDKPARRRFCFLWAAVVLAWAMFDTLAVIGLDLFGPFTKAQFALITVVYYVAACDINYYLINYILDNETGYHWILAPLIFWAFLPLVVPLETEFFNTDHLYYVFVGAAAFSAVLEIILLVVDSHGNRERYNRRFRGICAHIMGRVSPRPAYQKTKV